MAEPIIFTLVFGSNDSILEKIRKETVLELPTIVSLQISKESHISDKERIFAEILKESREQNKNPIFNIQLNNNNVKPIFKSQDLINLHNLNIKSTITFEHYSSLAGNPELAAYWKKIFAKTNHVFFANEQDRELAINENIINRDKATTITDIDSVLSVFNNLVDDKKVNKLLSSDIPEKADLDTLIKTTNNQGGRVIVKTWPISLEQATNLIMAKFGITSEDQIYGLKLEITEILKDPNNAAENLKKYVSQISQQFQKDLGKSEVNPIDVKFDKAQIMKNMPDGTQKEPIISYEPKEPEQQGFFRKVLNYFKSVITSFLGKKEESQAFQPQPMAKTESQLTELPKEQKQQPTLATTKQQTTQQINTNYSQKDWEKMGMTEQAYKAMMADNNPVRQQPASTYQTQPTQYNTAKNITQPNYLYNEDDIKKILEASIDKNKFSIFNHASLAEPELLKATLSVAIENLIVENKPAIIPLNTGHEHWLILVAKQDEKGNIKFIYNDPKGNPIGDRPKVTQYINAAYPGTTIEDLKTRQQQNKYDCGVFICDSAIKIANNKPILTTKEAENKGQELRNQHAEMLMNKQPNKFQDLVTNQRTSNIRTFGC